MSDVETQVEKNRRIRSAKIAIVASVAWWVASIGGIITVISLQS